MNSRNNKGNNSINGNIENLYDRLRRLQDIPGAYDAWADYRNELTSLVISCSHGGSLGIIGGGALNDIDIVLLARHFSSIIIYDCNTEAVYTGLERAGYPGNVTVKKADFTGIEDSVYKELADEVQFEMVRLMSSSFYGKDTAVTECTRHILERLEHIYDVARSICTKSIAKADYVLAAGVHSQLNNMTAWIFEVIFREVKMHLPVDVDIKEMEENVYERIRSETDTIIGRFNDTILDGAQKAAFIGVEDGHTDGAYQCMQDIWERNTKGQIRGVEKNLTWPFDAERNIIYDMKLFYVEH